MWSLDNVAFPLATPKPLEAVASDLVWPCSHSNENVAAKATDDAFRIIVKLPSGKNCATRSATDVPKESKYGSLQPESKQHLLAEATHVTFNKRSSFERAGSAAAKVWAGNPLTSWAHSLQ